jgi:aldose sugar dehydrogenase
MQYFVKIAKSFSILLLLALTLVIANTNMSSSIIVVVANEAHAATTSYSSNSDSSNATITKIQSINNNPPSLPAAPPAIIHRNTRAPTAIGGPTLNDPNLKVEQIINTGLKRTTSMAFLGPNDILVLGKETGKVHRILNGKILPEPLLDVNVASEAERGLLGIAIAKYEGNSNTQNGNTNANTRHVFLYYTESGGGKDGDDEPKVSPAGTATTTDTANSTRPNTRNSGVDSVPPAGNRLYRYDLDLDNNNNKLTNPKLLLNLPASPPPGREGTEKNHNGGKVLIGPDNNVYVGIGDVAGHRGQAENNPNGIATPDGTSGIIRVTQDGQFTNNPPLGTDAISLSLY